MLNELRFALRSLACSPGFTLASVLTLALGLGATTAIFSVLYAVLLRPFAYPHSERLVLLWQKAPQMEMSIAWPTVQDWQREQRTFSTLASYRRDRFNISDPGQLPENVTGAFASPEIFTVSELNPIAGRYFGPEENRPGADPVVVISERLWDRRFGRRPEVVGWSIPVDGVPRTVIGIAPASLMLPQRAEIWLPIAPYAATQKSWQTRGNNPGLYAIGRLKPDTTLEQAAADMERIYVGLRANNPDNLYGKSAKLVSYVEWQLKGYRWGLWTLLLATGVVLAIACANVASLAITRGMQQQRDYAVRAALGASRRRLVLRMVMESLLVSISGGIVAVMIASVGVRQLTAWYPNGTPRFADVSVDGTVLLFAVVMAILSGLLAGLWPAWKLSRADVQIVLHEGGRGLTGSGRARRFLVGLQVALTLVLLSVSVLILRSLHRMETAPLGFDPSNLLSFQVSLPGTRYGQEHRDLSFYQQLVERLKTLPGVASVAISPTPPLNTGWQSTFWIEGVHDKNDPNLPLAEMGIANDDYFSTLRVSLLKGRMFDARDATGPHVVIIDQETEKKYFSDGGALGRRIHWWATENEENNWFTVIGVVPTLRVYGYGEAIDRPQAYWSARQFAQLQQTVILRTTQNPRTLERPVRELLRDADADIALYDLSTVEEQVENTYGTTRFQSRLLSLFAGLALVLAMVGLYSVVAYGVALRSREIGIRLALGAVGRDVVTLMLREGFGPLGWGTLGGIAGALAAGKLLASQLYQVSPYDPWVLLGTAAVLGSVAALACWLPASRASQVNPVDALRSD